MLHNFCEFFAGAGLVREGLAASGWRCCYANDICARKQVAYQARYPDCQHFHLGDIWDTPAVLDRIPPRTFLATASFPCTDLSLAGLGAGLAGQQSSAFFGLTAVLKALPHRPPLLLIENVPALLTSHRGQDFMQVVQALASLGYWLDAFVIDASHFTPQSRPRLFIVGLQPEFRPPNVLAQVQQPGAFDPWRNAIVARPGVGLHRPLGLRRQMQHIGLPTGWLLFDLPPLPRRTLILEAVLTADNWWPQQQVTEALARISPAHRRQIEGLRTAGQTRTLTAFNRTRKGRVTLEVRFDGLSGCLRTASGGGARPTVIGLHRGRLRMRHMHPDEYARLQGTTPLPDTLSASDRLTAFGDAVCVPVITWIDQHVLTPVREYARPCLMARG